MKIVIAGGGGFLGRALTRVLLAEGHAVSILGRGASGSGATGADELPPRRSVDRAAWSPDGTVGPWASVLDGADAVVNLAGESLAAGRWSGAHKTRILESRVLATRSLVGAIRSVAKPPRVFISGSAVGYYGSRGDEVVTEDAGPGPDFLAGVCAAWEREATGARTAVQRLIVVRTSLVLDRGEGALPRMLTPFRLFAGGPVGSGRQYVSWIHRDDWVALMRWALLDGAVDGPLNATSPNPVANAEFARILGHVIARPSVVPTPAIAIKLALGEMGESLLLSSQRVIPARAIALGFAFRFPDLDAALRDVLTR